MRFRGGYGWIEEQWSRKSCRSPYEILGMLVRDVVRMRGWCCRSPYEIHYNNHPESIAHREALPFSLWDSSNSENKHTFSFSVAVLLMRFRFTEDYRLGNVVFVAVLLMRFLWRIWWGLKEICSCCRSPYEIQKVRCPVCYNVVNVLPFSLWDSA